MATVQLKNIKKVYPVSEEKKKEKKSKTNLEITEEGIVAVQSFNLDIKDKEFIVLVGPSGCGKSTTLRMVAGLEDITDGELIIEYLGSKAPAERSLVDRMPELISLVTVKDDGFLSLVVDSSEDDERVILVLILGDMGLRDTGEVNTLIKIRQRHIMLHVWMTEHETIVFLTQRFTDTVKIMRAISIKEQLQVLRLRIDSERLTTQRLDEEHRVMLIVIGGRKLVNLNLTGTLYLLR